ncbi:type II secretion system protein [Vibrio gallaecicus]|uniref:Type II secretion system protein n=1 Tax=Vibrio gallaecicus TaxID=552386 RepID=A0ABV4NG13_9VIBR
MKHKTGFTLLELVIVIVILGILAVTTGPRFLNYQRDSHETVSHASFSAFTAFTAAVNMYHSQWLVEGEPNFDQTVNYGVGDIYPSITGYPIAVDQLPISSGANLRGGDCVALWNALMDTDLTIRAHGADVFPSEHNIVAWYTAAPSCYYYYTSGYSLGEPIPRLDYFPLTGELVTSHRRPSS